MVQSGQGWNCKGNAMLRKLAHERLLAETAIFWLLICTATDHGCSKWPPTQVLNFTNITSYILDVFIHLVFLVPEKELQMLHQGPQILLRHMHLPKDLWKLHCRPTQIFKDHQTAPKSFPDTTFNFIWNLHTIQASFLLQTTDTWLLLV